MANRPEKYEPRKERFTIPADAEPIDDAAEAEHRAKRFRLACAEHLADLMREYCPPVPRRIASGHAA